MKIYTVGYCRIDDGIVSTYNNKYAFTKLSEAQERMKELYERSLKCFGKSALVSELYDRYAYISTATSRYRWTVDSAELPLGAYVTIEVHEGMVQNVYANSDIPVSVDVLDRDINVTSPADKEELDTVENALDDIRKNPAWKAVW